MKGIFKKLTLCVVFAALIFALTVLTASAASGSGTTGVIDWSVSGTTLTLSGNGMMNNYTLETTPEWYQDYKDTITTVNISNGITSVGSYAFYGLTNLTTVNVPSSVQNIGYGAFTDCAKLSTLTISNASAVVDGSAFNGCTALQTTVGGATYYKVSGNTTYALAKVTSTSFTVPSTTVVIADEAFKGLAITSISIPDSVVSIGTNAFASTSLTSVTFGAGVKHVGAYAFSGCFALANVTFNAVPSFIGAGAFKGTGLTGEYLAAAGNAYAILFDVDDTVASYTVNANTKVIASLAFENCTSLTSVVLPNGLFGIGDSAFNGCTALTSVNIPNTVKAIGDNAFKDCSALASVTIGSGVELIGNSAFRGTAITEIILLSTVKNVGFNAFRDCTSLTKLIFSADSGIGYKTFANCTSLNEIYLADSVLSIGESAFMNCTALRAISIPDTTEYIAYGALYGATSINKIAVPFIGEKANGANTAFTYIFGTSAPSTINTVLVGTGVPANAFSGVSIVNIIIDSNASSVDASAISGMTRYNLGSTFSLNSIVNVYEVGDVLDRANFKALVGALDVTDLLRFPTNPIASDEATLPAKLGSAVATFRTSPVEEFRFVNYSLLLEGTIGLKFYVQFDPTVDDSVVAAATANALFDGNTYPVTLEKADNVEDDRTYTATFYVAAKEMDKNVRITVSTADYSNYYEASVKTYVNYINANAVDYADCLEVVNEMYNYGQYSKNYFTGETITPSPDLSNVAISVSNAYRPNLTGSVSGVTFYGSSLLLESTTSIRHYFRFDNGVDPYSFTYVVNGQTVQLKQNSKGYFIEIENIIARNLGTNYSASVSKNSQTMTVVYAPMSYVKSIVENAGSNANLVNLSKALYNYFSAAIAYFGTTADGTITPDPDEIKPSIW